MKRLLLLGDEAIAQAAIDAGLSGMYAYPGTPSTEIMEYIQSSENARNLKIIMERSGRKSSKIPQQRKRGCC